MTYLYVALLLVIAVDLESLVNTAASDKATPLLIAAQEGHERIVEMLLYRGADADLMIETPVKAGPLQFAIYKNHLGFVSYLIIDDPD